MGKVNRVNPMPRLACHERKRQEARQIRRKYREARDWDQAWGNLGNDPPRDIGQDHENQAKKHEDPTVDDGPGITSQMLGKVLETAMKQLQQQTGRAAQLGHEPRD